MKVIHVFVIALVTFLIGFYAGMGTLKPYNQQLERDLNTVPAENKIDVTWRALSFAEQHSTNTVPFLETKLDESVSDLGYALQETPQSKWDGNAIEVLYRARTYRANHPWKSGDPNLDNAVSNAFSLLDLRTAP